MWCRAELFPLPGAFVERAPSLKIQRKAELEMGSWLLPGAAVAPHSWMEFHPSSLPKPIQLRCLRPSEPINPWEGKKKK